MGAMRSYSQEVGTVAERLNDGTALSTRAVLVQNQGAVSVFLGDSDSQDLEVAPGQTWRRVAQRTGEVFNVADIYLKAAAGTVTVAWQTEGAELGEGSAVGGNTAPSVSDTLAPRPNNATAYAASQEVNISLTVTGATNANPAVITTSAAHGLSVGQFVTIAGVTGNTAVNGTWKIGTVPSTTTFTLLDPTTGAAVAGNGAYVAGGTVAQLLALSGIARAAGKTGLVTKLRLVKSGSGVTNAQFRVYLFALPVAAVVDQAVATLLWANRLKRLGHVDVTLVTEGAGSDSAEGLATNVNLPFVSDNNNAIYARIVARGAYAPAALEQFLLELGILRD